MKKDVESGEDPLLNVSVNIKNNFIKKVYGILSLQLFFTFCFCGASIMFPSNFAFMQSSESLLIPGVLSIPIICLIPHMKHKYPHNIILLSLFTVCESFLLGHICYQYSYFGLSKLIVSAFAITGGLFTFISFYAYFSKTDFSFLNTYLFVGLVSLVLLSFMQIFFAYSIMSVAIAWFGILLFSGYILYDTSMILHSLGPDDAIEAALMLYLDIINLFLYILEVLRISRE